MQPNQSEAHTLLLKVTEEDALILDTLMNIM